MADGSVSPSSVSWTAVGDLVSWGQATTLDTRGAVELKRSTCALEDATEERSCQCWRLGACTRDAGDTCQGEPSPLCREHLDVRFPALLHNDATSHCPGNRAASTTSAFMSTNLPNTSINTPSSLLRTHTETLTNFICT